MKKEILFCAAMALGMSFAHGQTDKGSFLIGGHAGWMGNQTEASSSGGLGFRSRRMELSPNAMYFPVKRLALGLQTTFTQEKTKVVSSTGTSRVRGSTYLIGPVARYYFPFGKYAIFPEVGCSKQWSSWKNPYGLVQISFQSKSRTVWGGAGITYFMNANVALEGLATYTTFRDPSETLHDKLQFSIALQIYLYNKNKK